jgi:hypothetical protein
MAVQQRQHVDVVECYMFFSGPISTSVFDILQIPSWCNQSVVGAVYPIALPWLQACCSHSLFYYYTIKVQFLVHTM